MIIYGKTYEDAGKLRKEEAIKEKSEGKEVAKDPTRHFNNRNTKLT